MAAWAGDKGDKPLAIPAGAVQSQQAAVYDLFPTILRLAGAPVPADHPLDGSALHTLLQGQADPGREEAFLMHYPHAPHRSDYFTTLRLGGWKVIYHYLPTEVSGGSHYQLFNLKSDPYEQKDLAATEPAELKRLMTEMVRRLDAQGARYPVDKDGSTRLLPKVP
jgi:arylsulfatase A-like enzyme